MKVSKLLRVHGVAVLTVRPDFTLVEVARRFATSIGGRRFSLALVTDRDDQVLGVISRGDIAYTLGEHEEEAAKMLVKEVMTTDVIACGLDDDLEDVLWTMADTGICHMPVIESGKLAGLVARCNALEFLYQQASLDVAHLTDCLFRSDARYGPEGAPAQIGIPAVKDPHAWGDVYNVEIGAVGRYRRWDTINFAATWDQTRIIDANLFAEYFVPGEVATLTITLRLLQSRVRGKWQGQAAIDPEKGPVQVLVEAHGFELISEPPPPIDVPEDRDTPPIAFELRILEASERWLHVLVTQTGCPVGELAINDFSAIGAGPVQHAAWMPVRTLSEADLTLVMRDGRIEAYSPRDRASLSGVTITGFEYPIEPFRGILRNRLKALYDERADAEETERELQIVGKELTNSLPPDLIKLLRRCDIRSVMLRHEHDFEFPIELCYLDDLRDPFFVGDRIAICRWYMGVTNPPDVTAKFIRKVAFLKGDDDACRADETFLTQRYPGRMVTFARRADVIEQLFKTSDFDLIHFTGHCRVDDKGMGGLELTDGSFLRLIEIGQLESERAFTRAQPFVMVNSCASSQPYVALINRDSFPYRFVTNQACAFVGTLWPVSGPVANEFAQIFYVELTRKPIGRALLAAKAAIVQQDAEQRQEGVSPQRKLARQVAVRSYCLFANPDLRLVA